MFYFTRNHLLSSTCVQHAKTFAKMFYRFILHVTPEKHFFANVLHWLHVK